jgi:hypothetical protein
MMNVDCVEDGKRIEDGCCLWSGTWSCCGVRNREVGRRFCKRDGAGARWRISVCCEGTGGGKH